MLLRLHWLWARPDFLAFALGSLCGPQVIRKNIVYLSSFAYDLGMRSIEQFLNDRFVRGRAYFSREEDSTALEMP